MARARVGTVLGTMEVINDNVEFTSIYTMMVMIGSILSIGDGPYPSLFLSIIITMEFKVFYT